MTYAVLYKGMYETEKALGKIKRKEDSKGGANHTRAASIQPPIKQKATQSIIINKISISQTMLHKPSVTQKNH